MVPQRKSPSIFAKWASRLISFAPCSMHEAAIHTSFIGTGFPFLRSCCLMWANQSAVSSVIGMQTVLGFSRNLDSFFRLSLFLLPPSNPSNNSPKTTGDRRTASLLESSSAILLFPARRAVYVFVSRRTLPTYQSSGSTVILLCWVAANSACSAAVQTPQNSR